MVHLRLVVPPGLVRRVRDLLTAWPVVVNVIHLEGASLKPRGDVILCDVAREDASVVISELRALGLGEQGSISIEEVETSISEAAVLAEQAAKGSPADAVVWEQVESRTSESAELSFSFLAFMVLATLIAAVGIMTDSQILIIGAMVVGPEFGPLAGFAVAVVQRRLDLARRSFIALAVGFPGRDRVPASSSRSPCARLALRRTSSRRSVTRRRSSSRIRTRSRSSSRCLPASPACSR